MISCTGNRINLPSAPTRPQTPLFLRTTMNGSDSTPNPPATKPRLAYLDMTKGLLVVIMVIYHSLNYSTHYQLAFKYISFLPPSFIFIAGYLITAIYPKRYDGGDARLYTRLIIRGLKLVLLFTALNLGVLILFGWSNGRAGANIQEYLQRWIDIYLLGSGRSAIFEVLLPIGYFIAVSPLFLVAKKRSPLVLPIATLATIATCQTLALLNLTSENLNLVSAGVLGLYIGSTKAAGSHQLRKPLLLAAALTLYLIYIPVGLHHGYVYGVQLFGAFAAVSLLLTSSAYLGEKGWFQQQIILLGQYSLIAYIIQIAVLQVSLRIIGRPAPDSALFLALLLGTLIATSGLVHLAHQLRRINAFDRIYRFFFA